MKKNKLIMYLRWSLLALFTILITVAGYLHIKNGAGKSPSIHGLCPFGGLESIYQVFTTGSFINKIFAGTMILFVITIILAILFRRSFCGLICPFGAIQEFFGKIGQKIFGRKFVVSTKIDKPLRYLKYLILIITVYFAWKTAGLWMSPYDPWSAYAHLPEGLSNVWKESAVGLIILGLTIIGSLLYDRFFCKYLCPMGALYAIIGKISRFKVERNENACINCKICSKVCPMNINVHEVKEVKSAECINCQSCVLSCPKASALENKQGKKTIKPLFAIIAVLVVYFGSIFAFQAAGIYKMTPDKLKPGESISISEVKGYMTIKEAAEATNTEISEFYKLLNIPEDVPSDTKMKDISKAVPGFELDKAKETFEESEESKGLEESEVTESLDSSKAASELKSSNIDNDTEVKVNETNTNEVNSKVAETTENKGNGIDTNKASGSTQTKKGESVEVATSEEKGNQTSKTSESSQSVDAETTSSTNESETTSSTNESETINVEAVKGNMTIKASAEAINMELKEFYKLFKIDENVPSNTFMKDIGNMMEGYDFKTIKQLME